MPKKKLKRKKIRDPLNPAHQTRPRRDYIDYDYINKLDPKAREFLAKFTDEFYGGAFLKTESGYYSKKNIHRTAKLRRNCYNRNDASKRCIFTLAKITEKLQDFDAYTESYEAISDGFEDAVIEILDNVAKESSSSQEDQE